MAVVTEVAIRSGRRTELGLLAVAWIIAVGGRILVDLAVYETPDWGSIGVFAAIFAALCLVPHIVLRFVARSADPVMLPVVLGIAGVGLAMIHRIDAAYAEAGRETTFGQQQLMWVAIGVVAASTVMLVVRDHRVLRRFTWTAGLLGLILLLLPLVPGLGVEINGARIWIAAFGYSVQPGEFAKIALIVFFAGYLVTNRDTLALAGPKVLGIQFPRPRDAGPLLLVWAAALLVMISQRDLGASLLFFGIFLAMLYVATERFSWVASGLVLFLIGAVAAGAIFPHVARRYDAWLNALDPELYSAGVSEQLVRGLFGMASGGLFGTGLGEGRPDLVPFAESDFIIASIGEELGLTGLLAILMLYVILVHRALRTSIGVRDGFGKLLASGLGFAIALQVFIVVGGVTRVIPLTGLTTPFLAYGGSSMLANWIVLGLLLRVSDGARRPAEVRQP